MTAKEFYKKTSDLSYPLTMTRVNKDGNMVIGSIALTGKTKEDAEKFLAENNFFALNNIPELDNIDLETVVFNLEIHFGVDNYVVYEMEVCDVIDCRESGGRIVFSCTDNHTIIGCVSPEPEKKDERDDKNIPSISGSFFDNLDKIVCDTFDSIFNRFPLHNTDFNKMVEDSRKTISEIRDAAKNDKNTKFFDFSCHVSPDGKVSLKKTSNGMTIEKTFMLDEMPGKSDKMPESIDKKLGKVDAIQQLKDMLSD